jgi:hypothetical protein
VRRTLPFALHQLLELVVGLALIGLSIHVSRPGLLVATGVVFVALALLSQGRLGIVGLLPPRVHAALDVIVALAAALAPIFPSLRPDLTGILCVELAALAWLRVATLTRYRPGPSALSASSAALSASSAASSASSTASSAIPAPSSATPEPGATGSATTEASTDPNAGGAVPGPATPTTDGDGVTPARIAHELDRMMNSGSRRLGRLAGSLARNYNDRNRQEPGA